MPRVEFGSSKDMQAWISSWVMNVRSGKYQAYYTLNHELVLVPTTSTDPIVYGYLTDVDRMTAENVCKAFRLPMNDCIVWVWSADRFPGAER